VRLAGRVLSATGVCCNVWAGWGWDYLKLVFLGKSIRTYHTCGLEAELLVGVHCEVCEEGR
jgi:hypothetical protein